MATNTVFCVKDFFTSEVFPMSEYDRTVNDKITAFFNATRYFNLDSLAFLVAFEYNKTIAELYFSGECEIEFRAFVKTIVSLKINDKLEAFFQAMSEADAKDKLDECLKSV